MFTRTVVPTVAPVAMVVAAVDRVEAAAALDGEHEVRAVVWNVCLRLMRLPVWLVIRK